MVMKDVVVMSEFWKKHIAQLQPYIDNGYVFTFSHFGDWVQSAEHDGHWIEHTKWHVRYQGRYMFGHFFKPYYRINENDLNDMLNEINAQR